MTDRFVPVAQADFLLRLAIVGHVPVQGGRFLAVRMDLRTDDQNFDKLAFSAQAQSAPQFQLDPAMPLIHKTSRFIGCAPSLSRLAAKGFAKDGARPTAGVLRGGSTTI